MSTDITTPQNFADRMKARIKESIGDLITDEELSRLITSGIHETFFQPRKSSDGWRTTEKPPLMEEIVRELLTERVKQAVEKYIADNPEQLRVVLEEVVKTGVVNLFAQSMASAFLKNTTTQLEAVQVDLFSIKHALHSRGINT